MAVTEFAKEYCGKMFQDNEQALLKDLLKTDPEFAERFNNFAFDEVINEADQGLDDRTRFMAILAVLIGSQALDAFNE